MAEETVNIMQFTSYFYFDSVFSVFLSFQNITFQFTTLWFTTVFVFYSTVVIPMSIMDIYTQRTFISVLFPFFRTVTLKSYMTIGNM